MKIVFGDFLTLFAGSYVRGSLEEACPTSMSNIRVRILVGLFKWLL